MEEYRNFLAEIFSQNLRDAKRVGLVHIPSNTEYGMQEGSNLHVQRYGQKFAENLKDMLRSGKGEVQSACFLRLFESLLIQL